MPGLTMQYALMATDVDESLSDSLARFPKECRAHFAKQNPDWHERVRSAVAPIAHFQKEAA